MIGQAHATQDRQIGTDGTAAPASAWSPFRHRAFAMLWVATVLSNIGTWMADVGAGWLMTTLSSSPEMVALVQAATALPMFLFALPAGTLADLVDRRRMLLVVTAVALVIALTFGLVVAAGAVTALPLLVVTLAMGTCAAVMAPTWQAIVPQLVPRPELQPAIALNSMGINISRAIGPALGGLLIVQLGIAWPFLMNGLSFLAVLAALAWWRPPARKASALPGERLMAGMRSGWRYARASPPLRATLARAVAFFVPASAAWALLPLVVRGELAGDAALYGLLLACVGTGAVVGAFVLPGLKRRLTPDRLLAGACLLMAVVLAGFVLASEPVVAVLASLGLGMAWIAALSTLNVSAQTALPDWVRARGLAVFVMAFFGSMTAGSVLWGQVASGTSISTALLGAAGLMLVGIVATRRQGLQAGAGLDLTPSSHWPEPITANAVGDERGPVLVTIDYRIDAADRPAFVEALHALAPERWRDGGYGWGMFEDAARPEHLRECFYLESWLTHVRQHERVTEADRALQDRARAFHRGDGPPIVTHHLAL